MLSQLRICHLGIFLTSMVAGALFVSVVNKPSPDTRKKVEYLVANRTLSVGERIVHPEDCFRRIATCFEADLPPDAISSFDDLDGGFILKHSLNVGDHITLDHIYEAGGLDIPEGLQAVGIPVKRRFLPCGVKPLPGSYVDVHWLPKEADGDEDAKVILKEILAVHADGGPREESEFEVVTLALSKADKQRIVAVHDKGWFRIVLPNRVDALVAKRDLRIGEVFNQPRTLVMKKSIRKEDTPKDQLAEYRDVKDRILNVPVRKGEPITRKQVSGVARP